MQIRLISQQPEHQPQLEQLAQRWQLINDENSDFALVLTPTHLELQKLDEPKLGAIYVDWVSGASNHRRKFGGGKGQAIAKAVGLKNGVVPTVLDGTAGLGRDAFVLASLGCKVQMFERHPVVAALLDDGLRRAKEDPEIGAWVTDRVSLLHVSSLSQLSEMGEQSISKPDVIYLDPMYPHKKKSALVKKEMRVFQTLVGADLDADGLLDPALKLASKRVVVKRPDYAEPLANIKPSTVIATKKNRFDIYVNSAMK